MESRGRSSARRRSVAGQSKLHENNLKASHKRLGHKAATPPRHQQSQQQEDEDATRLEKGGDPGEATEIDLKHHDDGAESYDERLHEDSDCECGSDSDSDAGSLTSNQTEDDDERDGLEQHADAEEDESEEELVEQQREASQGLVEVDRKSLKRPEDESNDNQRERPAYVSRRPPLGSLSVAVAEPKKKGIQEPRNPRGSATARALSSSVAPPPPRDRKSRHKFQFPDAELLKLVLEEEQEAQSSASSGSKAHATATATATSARRASSSTTGLPLPTMLPLRRQSFSLTKSPLKSFAALSPRPPVACSSGSNGNNSSSSRLTARRKSSSACLMTARSPLVVKSGPAKKASASAAESSPSSSPSPLPPPAPLTTSSQMVLRVRERKSDGLPELVIAKRPARTLVWQWPDRQVRVPFMIQLGPHQHGVMLRQLRYVKSVMNDFPWAKTHLKELLASYTKKDLTKEQLYPQLNLLSYQLQGEIGTHVKKQRQLAAKKQRLTTQLSLATTALNELQVTKYGRRGKPHETRLSYDPGEPTKLHWVRKNGERSAVALDVDVLRVQCYDSGDSSNMSKPLKRFAHSARLDCCVSLIAPTRSLDLQLRSSLHRDWLVNALHDVIAFARQYKAASAASRALAQPSKSQGRQSA
ncbi:hypothetical protein P43SY_008263 [Pythium insidiosum]|uniref:Uncharacterized protein n=1 Tax=Pythium insidiosum TaxID=114742 RepID=A0AAD5LB62_PYTIN|nr:hypothetical protein P43SY_008263 [Pythium insidiosum]